MQQPLEVIKMSQRSLAHIHNTLAGLDRVQGHQRRAVASYWKGITNPLALTDESAKRLTAIEHTLGQLQRELEDARVQLAQDADYYMKRIAEATPAVQAELDRKGGN